MSPFYRKEYEWRWWGGGGGGDGIREVLRDAKNWNGGWGGGHGSQSSWAAVQLGGNKGLVGRRRGRHCSAV